MAWQLLFTSEMGLLSLFVIVFIVAMAVWFSRFFLRKINEDARRAGEPSASDAASRPH